MSVSPPPGSRIRYIFGQRASRPVVWHNPAGRGAHFASQKKEEPESVLGHMPHTYLVFGDIEGKLGGLRVECTKCDRKGRYHVHKLIEKHGRMGNMMKWREMLNADCPKRDGRLNDRCDLVCPESAEGPIARDRSPLLFTSSSSGGLAFFTGLGG
jgi:hypothetical protein